MFGLFESNDNDGEELITETLPGEEVSLGCDHHHFEDYEQRNHISPDVEHQMRHFDDSVGKTGEWRRYVRREAQDVDSPVDERRVIVVRRRYAAKCEHEGCDEVDEEYRVEDTYVHEEHIKSTPEDREPYEDGDAE